MRRDIGDYIVNRDTYEVYIKSEKTTIVVSEEIYRELTRSAWNEEYRKKKEKEIMYSYNNINQVTGEEFVEGFEDSRFSPETIFQRKLAKEEILDAAKLLKPGERDLFLYIYAHLDLTDVQIAKDLGIHRHTLMQRRENIRKKLKDYEFECVR